MIRPVQRMMAGRSFLLILLFSSFFPCKIWAHPMPYSMIWLDVQSGGIHAGLQLPMPELELAMGKNLPASSPFSPLAEKEISGYILTHLRMYTPDHLPWKMEVMDMHIAETEQMVPGAYTELDINLWLEPPPGKSTRSFTFFYDAIIHQVESHKALVAVRQDWANGQPENAGKEIGIIAYDPGKKTVPALEVNLEQGNAWKGFLGTVHLGFEHISEGADHLLFIFLLLLPAPLMVINKRWEKNKNLKQGIFKLLKIVTAFTIGHSLTLALAALNWVRLPSQPVEICIGFTILLTAIHVIFPVFPKKEMLVAAFFGLIHGLAFATVLSELHLDRKELVLSILGFNTGIELMQLFFVLITIPWLMILSRYKIYNGLRITGASLAIIAAAGWVVERFTEKPNLVSSLADTYILHFKWFVIGLAILAILALIVHKIKPKKPN